MVGFGPQTDDQSVSTNQERVSPPPLPNESQELLQNGSPNEENQTLPDLLQFTLDASIQNGAVSEYSAPCNHSPTLQLNYEAYITGVVGASLVQHIQDRISNLGYGVRMYWTLNTEFWRTLGEGGDAIQTVFTPFRQAAVTYSINDEEYISTRIGEGVQVAIEKVNLFLQSGYVISY